MSNEKFVARRGPFQIGEEAFMKEVMTIPGVSGITREYCRPYIGGSGWEVTVYGEVPLEDFESFKNSVITLGEDKLKDNLCGWDFSSVKIL